MSYGIVANAVKDKVFRQGAKVWILRWNGDFEHVIVRGISLGGRRVTKYTPFKSLHNYRAAWIPPTVAEDVCATWATKEAAQKAADNIARAHPLKMDLLVA